MSQVNFYTLSNPDPHARLQFVCRLTEKATELGHQVFIQTATAAEAKLLDDLLWQFKPASFIPHALVSKEDTAVTIGVSISAQNAPAGCNGVLINLTDRACEQFQQFARINEIVAANLESIQAGRERYRVYRDAGVALETFKI